MKFRNGKEAKMGQKRPLSVWTVDRDLLGSSLKSEYLARKATTVQKYELARSGTAAYNLVLQVADLQLHSPLVFCSRVRSVQMYKCANV